MYKTGGLSEDLISFRVLPRDLLTAPSYALFRHRSLGGHIDYLPD